MKIAGNSSNLAFLAIPGPPNWGVDGNMQCLTIYGHCLCGACIKHIGAHPHNMVCLSPVVLWGPAQAHCTGPLNRCSQTTKAGRRGSQTKPAPRCGQLLPVYGACTKHIGAHTHNIGPLCAVVLWASVVVSRLTTQAHKHRGSQAQTEAHKAGPAPRAPRCGPSCLHNMGGLCTLILWVSLLILYSAGPVGCAL